MEEKNVYSIDPATLGQKKTVAANYKINTLYETEVEPPANYLILAWDNKTRSWYDAGSGVHEGLENQDQQLTDAMMAIAELYEQNLDILARLDVLEGNAVPLKKIKGVVNVG